MSAKLISKISAKSVGSDFSRARDEAVPQFQVIGSATSYKRIETNYGASDQLNGTFEAINLITGEVFNSGKCFLPSIVSDQIVAQLQSDENVQVKFAYEIGTTPSTSTIGYEYTVRSLIDAQPLALIEEIRSQIGAPALEAPKAKTPKSK